MPGRMVNLARGKRKRSRARLCGSQMFSNMGVSACAPFSSLLPCRRVGQFMIGLRKIKSHQPRRLDVACVRGGGMRLVLEDFQQSAQPG